MVQGFPIRIVGDTGTAFTSEAFVEFLNENKVVDVRTTTGVARGNGQASAPIGIFYQFFQSFQQENLHSDTPCISGQKALIMHVYASIEASPFVI